MEKSSKKWENIGIKIFQTAKNELSLSMKHLYPAIENLEIVPDTRVNFLATDGKKLYFSPMLVAKKYLENPVFVNRAYLHSLLHCLFLHVYKGNGDLWNLSCDIMVEGIIDELEFSSVQVVVPPLKEEATKRISKAVKIFSAEYIYEYLQKSNEDIFSLENLYTVDDHRFWEDNKNEQNKKENYENSGQDSKNLWENIRKKIQTDIETYSRSIGLEKTKLYQNIVIENREKVSYESFLKKFREPIEEIKIDLESFDYGFYNYGLTLYGNMPLIEENEYRVTSKIKNFIIVIDTSGSIKKDTVSAFLGETVNILTEGDIKRQCTILQSDNQIQEVKTIRNLEDLNEYIKNFTIIGRGGTDFRPAFAYIDDEVTSGRMEKPSGLIYFTDGYGIYPKARPKYEVAFVFPESCESSFYENRDFPVWAMHITIKEGKYERKRSKR